ncbi:MAG: ornithine carbamoyltransferase [Opitutae bacterium]|nr:ornithine carbamoyltransferase [Opitutae bacterium]
MKHFLEENNFTKEEIQSIFENAFRFKENRKARPSLDLKDQSWGMLFYKNSTRTRVSFEVGIRELGGNPILLDLSSTQIGRGESVQDTAKVLSRFLDGLVIRTHGHDLITEFANYAEIPVVNALTDFLHPCQIYSDCMTLLEKTSDSQNPAEGLKDKKLAFFGDTSCNMANSWILAGAIWGLDIWLCGPEEFKPTKEIEDFCRKFDLPIQWHFTSDCKKAAHQADVLYTDVWVSMGCEDQKNERMEKMSPFRITEDLFEIANQNALFMHCMPAHPGEEVTEEVLGSTRSILFDQAENRLHMQKAILKQLVNIQN